MLLCAFKNAGLHLLANDYRVDKQMFKDEPLGPGAMHVEALETCVSRALQGFYVTQR